MGDDAAVSRAESGHTVHDDRMMSGFVRLTGWRFGRCGRLVRHARWVNTGIYKLQRMGIVRDKALTFVSLECVMLNL